MSTEILHKSTKKRLVPKLRFKDFVEEWNNNKLFNHVHSISSGKVKPYDEGEFLVYGSTGIIGKSNSFSHNGDYILVARVGANAGQINRVKGKFAVTDNTLIIDLKEDVSVSFCESFLINFNLNKLIFGSGQPLITGGLLKEINFIFPSLPEQQKIASFLSAVDEKIQQLTRKKELLEQYKKGVMQQLFSGKLRFKDDKGNGFPEWEEKKFGDIYSFYSTNSLSREKLNYENGEVKNIHYGDIHTKFKTLFDITKESVPFINSDFDISKIKEELFCQEGDLVIADASEDYADIGKSIEIVNLNNEKLIAGLHTLLARPNKIKMCIGFSGYIIRSNNFRKQIMIIAQGSKVLSISTGRLALVKMRIPIVEEQQKIANFLSSIDVKIENVNQQVTQAKNFKKGLLQQLFV